MEDNFREKPIVMMTGNEIISLLREAFDNTNISSQSSDVRRFVYGISGISELFQCSLSTATRMKKSGILDEAITQVGRKIIVDAELALALASKYGKEIGYGKEK